jgi:hypothetical protein
MSNTVMGDTKDTMDIIGYFGMYCCDIAGYILIPNTMRWEATSVTSLSQRLSVRNGV